MRIFIRPPSCLRLAGALAAAILATAAHAQGAYPQHAVKMIVPYPPGGGVDGIARPFAEKLQAELRQPVVIENRAGANGNIGAQAVARSENDGYTLLFGNEFLTTNPAVYKTLPYDTRKDFVPVLRIGVTPLIMAVGQSLPAHDLASLVKLSQTRPLTYGTPGIGSSPHLFGEYINLHTPLKLRHIPYKGTSPAIADAIGGQIDIVFTSLSSLVPQIQAGKLRGIAVLSNHRSALLPNIPTLAEGGLPDLERDTWYALMAPAGTPAPALRTLHDAALRAISAPAFRDTLSQLGYEAQPGDAKEMAAVIDSELVMWRDIAKDIDLNLD